MASNVDMSLDDFITKNKISTRGNRRGGRGGLRGRGSGGRGTRRPSRGRGQRGGRMGRSPGFRSPRGGGNINGRWSHDMYYGGASAVRTSGGPTKLNITNLDFGVSDSDIKELFSEFGNMKTASVHYDRTGRSLGTAHVIFERRADALKAIKQYNGVHLDGRPMHIEIDGGGMSSRGSIMNGSRGGPRNLKRLRGGPRPIDGGRGRGGRGGRGIGGLRGKIGRGGARGGRGGRRGGGRGAKKIPTAEELDAELEEYTFQASK
ncbi:UNVERIFIED_CONTAM: hypothetical protein RMT77_016956 [Armadillidium vulgare]